MNDPQWERLIAVINGETIRPLPTGFIIDSPWIPKWAGCSILDYFTSERIWFDTNIKAVETFPQTFFLPGFWGEFGMCTEPSAFGAVCTFEENEFPFAKKLLRSAEDVDRLEKPDPKKDGLLPFVIKRLEHVRPEIEKAGHKIRFAAARGPLNIASFLMGGTEFLMALKLEPERMHRLIRCITDFLSEWIDFQRECFPSIDGILILDDIVGFVGEADFKEFGLPYFKQLYAGDVAVKFFHNDSPCMASAPFYTEIGINLLNFGTQHTINEMKTWTDNKITLLGNLPPRDALEQASPEAVQEATRSMIGDIKDPSRVILSCGGGMPPGVTTENISAFIAAVESRTA
jgi:uroporphyrinogen-III decarboxylase